MNAYEAYSKIIHSLTDLDDKGLGILMDRFKSAVVERVARRSFDPINLTQFWWANVAVAEASAFSSLSVKRDPIPMTGNLDNGFLAFLALVSKADYVVTPVGDPHAGYTFVASWVRPQTLHLF